MAAPNISLNSQSHTLMRRAVRPPAFGEEPAAALQLMPSRSLPARVAVVGNHLPRQCGIATFTTDLCDAMADEYGGGRTTVVAINDRQSSYAYGLARYRDRHGVWCRSSAAGGRCHCRVFYRRAGFSSSLTCSSGHAYSCGTERGYKA